MQERETPHAAAPALLSIEEDPRKTNLSQMKPQLQPFNEYASNNDHPNHKSSP
jgi:hypothetical protein